MLISGWFAAQATRSAPRVRLTQTAGHPPHARRRRSGRKRRHGGARPADGADKALAGLRRRGAAVGRGGGARTSSRCARRPAPPASAAARPPARSAARWRGSPGAGTPALSRRAAPAAAHASWRYASAAPDGGQRLGAPLSPARRTAQLGNWHFASPSVAMASGTTVSLVLKEKVKLGADGKATETRNTQVRGC